MILHSSLLYKIWFGVHIALVQIYNLVQNSVGTHINLPASYIQSLGNSNSPSRPWRSSDQGRLIAPESTVTTHGDCFSVLAPRPWKSLSLNIWWLTVNMCSPVPSCTLQQMILDLFQIKLAAFFTVTFKMAKNTLIL